MTDRPADYDDQNARYVAGLRRLLQAVREGPPLEDPVRLDLGDGEDRQPHPQPKVSPVARLRLYNPTEGE